MLARWIENHIKVVAVLAVVLLFAGIAWASQRIEGAITFAGPITVETDITVADDLTAAGDFTANGNSVLGNNATADAVTLTGVLTQSGVATIGGATTFSTTTAHSGAATFASMATFAKPVVLTPLASVIDDTADVEAYGDGAMFITALGGSLLIWDDDNKTFQAFVPAGTKDAN